MNRKQLLSELGKKFYKVGMPEPAEVNPDGVIVRQREGIAWYIVPIYEQSGDVLSRRNFSMYVENEGEKDEQAFYGERISEIDTVPVPPMKNLFANVEGTVEQAGKDFVVVRRWIVNKGVASEKRFLVKKSGTEFIEFAIKEEVQKPVI